MASTGIAEAGKEEPWGIDGSIVLYGIFADIALIVPLVLYIVLPDTSAWAQYHQTYINMIFSAYAPLGITWFIVAFDDSQVARTALTGAIEMAGLGPFALFWVGLSTFLMSIKADKKILAANYLLWMWGPIYGVVNILLIVMHYHLSAPMYAWIKAAPPSVNAIDDAKPWAMPEEKAAAKAVVENK